MHAVYQNCLLTFCNFFTKQDYFLATSNCTCAVTQFADNKVRHGLWSRMENTQTVMYDLLVKRLNSNLLHTTLHSPKMTEPKHWHSHIFQSQPLYLNFSKWSSGKLNSPQTSTSERSNLCTEISSLGFRGEQSILWISWEKL